MQRNETKTNHASAGGRTSGSGSSAHDRLLGGTLAATARTVATHRFQETASGHESADTLSPVAAASGAAAVADLSSPGTASFDPAILGLSRQHAQQAAHPAAAATTASGTAATAASEPATPGSTGDQTTAATSVAHVSLLAAATTSAATASAVNASAAVTSPVSTNTATTTTAATAAAVASPSAASASAFTVGDLVISVYGDGDGSGSYGDNQAAPIVLEELTTGGTEVMQMTLPQTTTVVNGVTEYAVSGEYGSSSEGTLELSADGQSLVIAGYAVNAATYNAGGAAVYGNAALAQSTSIQGGQYTAVARVIADIRADGSVDSSTALYNVDNTNNPRSVATVNGSSFYLSGQGVKGDTTQGVFLAQDGASSATAIDTSTDTRTVEISNGTLYVSRDSKQGPTSSISSYGGLPTSATASTTLPGIAGSDMLTAAQANTVDTASIGKKIYLSPENYFFANSTTLYVADSGNPKQGGLGDGGLQKWTLSGGTWTLDYTLSGGLNLVANTAASGTTGLIGLTGTVTGNTVTLYATNATIGDLDQTYLFGITDSLSATTNAGESFTTLATAATGTNIRGVAFAPGEAPCFAAGTMILTDRGERPVERLAAGDVAITIEGDRRVPARIRWIGRRRIDVAAHPDPSRVRPIRFAPDAIADGVPCRTMRLSPDHAILLDGVLVAARALVNGASIVAEPVPSVQYFHVELERHGILLADNTAAESYLDTGNRHQFAGGIATSLHPSFDRAEHPDACAPLATDPAIVAPIWHRLAARAPVPTAAAATTRDAALALDLPDGVALAPAAVAADGRHTFWLDGISAATLRSRAQSPAGLRPWLDDRRRLGVGIAAIECWTLAGGLDPVRVETGGSGWWPQGEGDPVRWTDGAARIALPEGCVRLDVIVAATTEYALAA